MTPSPTATAGRLDRLLPLLAADPENVALLADAAETALSERRPEIATELFDRAARLGALRPEQANLAGLAAMQAGRFEEAAKHLEPLVDRGIGGPAVRFNLAWALAMSDSHADALKLLDDETARSLPQAAMLKVQILHDLGELSAASEAAELLGAVHSEDPGLLAATSVLAVDLDDLPRAEQAALAAGDHPDALTTLGILALDRDNPAEALRRFDQAIELRTATPRAWLGRGLARLLAGGAEDAATDLDRGAEMFGDHLGSWIAAGWAWFIRGDLTAARGRFERALAIDPTFAEAQGSLAAIDILEGHVEAGRERAEKAVRLDRNSFSAALARILLASASGDQGAARRIFDIALNTPVDESGRTVAQAAARLGLRGGS